MNRLCTFLLLILFMTSCGSNRSIRIDGQLLGIAEQSVYLEKVTPSAKIIVDSATTDKKGMFKFEIRLEEATPTFYNLVTKKGSAPLLLSPGERITFSTVGDKMRYYTVEGSTGSKEVQEINTIFKNGISTLDSLGNLYTNLPAIPATASRRDEVVKAYTEAYYQVKRDQIGFIVSHPGSLAALYALYQRLPNDPVLFNGESDIVYYQMVSDSVGSRYSTSPYLAALRKEIQAKSTMAGIANMLNSNDIETVSYPDIELPNLYGEPVKLSSLAGQVILLDFWNADETGKLHNAELREVYDELSGRGFSIYQVCLNLSKPEWVTAVQGQKIPWISVNDFRGSNSPAAQLYNIQKVPANFLIDREGNIVARDLDAAQLRDKLTTLL